MNLATSVSIVAAAVEAVMAVLAFVFAKAPGWRHLRVFALVAASAAGYSAINVAFSVDGVSDATILWALRLNYLAACVHCAAWLLYSRVQYHASIQRSDRAAVLALGALALLGLIPGLLASTPILELYVPWAGVTYRTPSPTPLGALLMAIPPLVLLVPLVRYFRKTQRHVAGALAHFLAFCVFFLLAVNEALVTVGVIASLYLADVGFLVAVLSVLSEMANRVATDAKRLLVLSTALSRTVEERTREVVEAREVLMRAERLSALGRLSASVGHEINNPLSYVVGNLEYAISELERGPTSNQVLNALGDAREGAERIRRIVRELRVFGKGSPEPHRELTNPSEALESALKLTGNELRCRATLSRQIETVPQVLADPTQLTQVIVNLLLNAAQAIPEEQSGTASSVITVRSRRQADGRVAIEVSDTGRGISEADQKRLFEPFFTTKPLDQGTGLGLFVSLGIISSFQGEIEVESRLGAGTTVRVLLPVAKPAPAPARVSSRPPSTARDRRLLLVDDDILVARSIARLLDEHEVEVVTSGKAALRRLLEHGPAFDLVFCDLMMPDMTGMDLFEEIERARPLLADRFVFISGGGVTDRCRQFIESHHERVLSKPIDTRAIKRVLAHHAAAGWASELATPQ
jgi:signal transduction histidine kinase/ActR/RegA family two-component response regulator